MRLTILGATGAFPGPGQACSGYLLETGTSRIVVDLGWGTLPRLFDALGSHTGDGLDAVVVTHEHPDHMADLYGLFRARWFGRRGGSRIPLIAPDEVRARLAWEHDGRDTDLAQVFGWRSAPGGPIQLADVRFETAPLPHDVPNVGVRIVVGDSVVAFTGDTGPSPAVAEVGRDADLFVVDATDRHQQPGVAPVPPGSRELNLTAEQAGLAAREAGARRLLITHHWPGNDLEVSRAAAATSFTGEVIVARDGLVVDLP